MPRVLATVDDEQKAWVESLSDSLDVAEAEVIRRLIDAGREDESLIESDMNHDSVDDSGSESDVIQRLDELEQRVAMLEQGKVEEIRAETGVERATDTPTDSEGADSGAEASEGEDGRDPSPDASSGRVEPPDAPGDVRERVAEIAEGWADDDRLDDRIDAAVAAVATARERGSLGKSEAVDELEPKFPVRGQDGETWWRKNVRPVLRELGTYDSGSHGYRVEMD